MTTTIDYDIKDVAPYINWLYFYHAWGVAGKPDEAKRSLRQEAEEVLRKLEGQCQTHAVFGLFDANADGDDIVVGGVRLPMLRQQTPMEAGQPNLCMADFVRPQNSEGITDRVGVFAATVDKSMEVSCRDDGYAHMLMQTLADRLAEATAEKMHQEVRTRYWGYAPDENLTMEQLHREDFQGIRPAVGYPSMPDTSLNFLLDRLIDFSSVGIRLTESGMMMPHASVSGLMLAHPGARYFNLGRIDETQLHDYARRRGVPVELMRRFLAGCLV